MAKNKRQFSIRRLYKNPLFILAFLLAFGSLAAIVITSRAEPYKKYRPAIVPKQLAFGYSNEKPTVARSENGAITYISRPRSVEVTTEGTLYCTPEDNGIVTSRQLTNEEQGELDNQVDQSRSNNLSDDVGQKDGSTVVNNFHSLTLRDNGSTTSARFHSTKSENLYYKKSVALLNRLCKNKGTQLRDGDIPEVVMQTSPKQSVLSRLAERLVPKAYAGDPTAPPPPEPTQDRDASDFQQVSLNVYRQQNGKPYLIRDPCLDYMAALWAYQLAKDGYIHHSNIVEQYMNRCPTTPDGYRGAVIAVGENVGMQPGLDPNQVGQAISKYASDKIFTGFVNSPGHRNNMLSITQPYQFDGIGAYRSADKTGIFIVQAFRYNSGYVAPTPTK